MNAVFAISIFVIHSCTFTLSLTEENPTLKDAKQHQVCESPACLKAAHFISKNTDTAVNPCDNFYQFACGKYIKKSSVRDDTISASVLRRGSNRLKQQLKESIENRITKNDSRALRLLKSHYDSCLDVEKVEKSSLKILLDILNRLGGWPVLVGESWDGSSFDWKNLNYQLRSIGFIRAMNSLIDIQVQIDEKDNTKHVLILDQPTTEIAHQYLVQGLKHKVTKLYYKYMVDITRILGMVTPGAKKELLGSLLFEIELAKISAPEQERRNMSQLYNPMTVDEFQSKYPDVSWKEYLNELLLPQYVVESTERIIVGNLNYLKSVLELISKTPKRVLANYMIWHLVKESTAYLNSKVQSATEEFVASAYGTGLQQARWGECIDYLTDYFALAVGAMYIRKVFDPKLKKQGIELVEDLRKSFKNSLEKVDWMDEKTKRKALKKLKSMYAVVAYPDELLDDNKVSGVFKDLKINPESYLDSYLSVNHFNFEYSIQVLNKSHNRADWVSHGVVADFNAYYILLENSILIPAGFFQEELFDLNKPNYMNYAGLGYFIGHELTHAFDDEGSQFNEKGNLANWWKSNTYKEYQKRAQCIVNQYSNYTVREVNMKINGINTQGENIADNGGIKQAYFAYEEYEKRNGPEPRLPGLPYSPRQLFWISNANIYCETFIPEALKNFIITEEHCPGKFRVIGTFSNSLEFAKDFECPLGSVMNPVKKCTFW